MTDATFRPMEGGEAAEVIALWHAAGLVRPWNPPEADLAEIARHPHAEILVARAAGRIAATLTVGHDGHRGWVYYLAVAPGQTRRGWGRRAMAAAEDWLRARGLSKIQLMVRRSNAPVTAFYEALGYEDAEVVVMQKWLDPDRARLYREGADGH